jgi:predicted enzyme related to lactoylglutathione lyase
VSDTPEFRYTIMQHGEEQLAGIMDASGFLPEGAPAHRAVYFGTEDADASLATITSLGGSVVRPAEDTPYGRLAEAADPTGVHFKLVAPNDAMPRQGVMSPDIRTTHNGGDWRPPGRRQSPPSRCAATTTLFAIKPFGAGAFGVKGPLRC